MACGCKGKTGIRYEAKFTSGGSQTYDTLGEAQQAITAAGGGTFRAVPA